MHFLILQILVKSVYCRGREKRSFDNILNIISVTCFKKKKGFFFSCIKRYNKMTCIKIRIHSKLPYQDSHFYKEPVCSDESPFFLQKQMLKSSFDMFPLMMVLKGPERHKTCKISPSEHSSRENK